MKPTKESLVREVALSESRRLPDLIHQTQSVLQLLASAPGEEKEIEEATLKLRMYKRALQDVRRSLSSS